MNISRTTPNLIDEAAFMLETDLAYGAAILARVIGRALAAEQLPDPGHPLKRTHLVAGHYGAIINQAVDGTARRHIIMTDAAELAFSASMASVVPRSYRATPQGRLVSRYAALISRSSI